MIPVLFDKTSRTWETAGIGLLTDCISCVISEERNGKYEGTLTYPTNGIRFDKIGYGSIILAKPNLTSSPQPFRVYSVGKPIDGTVSFGMEHISYELTKNQLPAGQYTGSPANIVNAMLEASLGQKDYTAAGNVTTVSTVTVDKPGNVRTLIGGSDNSVLANIDAELEWDGRQVIFHEHRGSDHGMKFTKSKNLVSYNYSANTSEFYDWIYPYASTQMEQEKIVWYWDHVKGLIWEKVTETVDVIVTLPEITMAIPGTESIGYPCIKDVDLSSEFEDGEVINANSLRQKAQKYLTKERDLRSAQENLTINFVLLRDTIEYQNVKELETVNLCDTVEMIDPDADIDVSMMIIKTSFDSLAERYDSVEVGHVNPKFTDQLNDEADQWATTWNLWDAFSKFVGGMHFNVFNGAIGKNSTLQISAGGKDFNQEIDMSQVRQAFADDETDLDIVKGKIRFKSNTFAVESSNFKVTEEGKMTCTEGQFDGNASINGMPVPQMQTGKYDCTCSDPDSVASYNIVFPKEFKSQPKVLVSPSTSRPHEAEASANGITTKGFTLYFHRNDATVTTVAWAAFL